MNSGRNGGRKLRRGKYRTKALSKITTLPVLMFNCFCVQTEERFHPLLLRTPGVCGEERGRDGDGAYCRHGVSAV